MVPCGVACPEPHQEVYKRNQDLKLKKDKLGMFKRNVGKYTFLSIFELMGTYPRDTGETSGDRRLKKGKDCTFLV